MKICSQCHDEYRDEITTCSRCHIELTAHVEGASLPSSTASTIDLESAIKAFEGQLSACQELEAILKKQRIACLIATVKGPNSMSYAVCINPGDVEKFQSAMRAHFNSLVEKEHDQEWELKDVHLDGGDVTCPACGHTGQLQAGMCADCGLMLGVDEPACGS